MTAATVESINSRDQATPVPPAKDSALKAWLRSSVDQDIVHMLQHLTRPGDRVLEVTAAPRAYAGKIPGILPETIQVDTSQWKTEIAALKKKIPQLTQSRFDVIFLQGVVSYAADIQELLQLLQPVCHADTRLVLLSYNAFWQPVLKLATALKARASTPDENWLSSPDLTNLLLLAGYEMISLRRRVLLPPKLPVLNTVFNRILATLPGTTWLGLCDWYVARAKTAVKPHGKVSVVVPARNEAGNIRRILDEMPKMGTGVEVLFVEGHSKDDTWPTIEREAKNYKGHVTIKTMQQKGKGKKDASFLGFDEATGDLLMILDADITVPPADLPKFYEAWRNGHGEFINGTRLVYPMQDEAMRFLNLLGNRFFAAAFSYIMGQQLKDTLCGTKVLSRRNWERLDALRKAEFGERDPFGDFDLLFGASRLQLKIVEVPIRYQARTYGETNINRWSHGWMLLKMSAWGLQSLKFV
ncbi:MAG: glycosyltransferase family 2 protein [Archangiaceae bacterium]|nr:glycosyltransferase family 2 protein [Archangiaceae bacterium]